MPPISLHTHGNTVQCFIFRDLDTEIKGEITKIESWLEMAQEGDAITLNSENCKYPRFIDT